MIFYLINENKLFLHTFYFIINISIIEIYSEEIEKR